MHRIINEGGNLQLKGKKAEKINLKVANRTYIVGVLRNILSNLDKAFAKQYKTPLWDPKVLQSGEFFSGSSLHLFNLKGIDDKTFIEKKPLVGDIDTMVDKAKKDQLTQFLAANEGKQIGSAVFIGSKGQGAQTVTLWENIDPPFTVQIDFEFVEFKNGTPTEWSKFSHSSAWEDIQQGIKGVFHKFLIQSLAATSQRNFLSAKLKPVTDNMYSFAISSKAEGGGLRVKYEPVIDPKTNKPKVVDGVPVLKSAPTVGYEQNLDKIFSTLFRKKFTAAQLKKMRPLFWSFSGIVQLMNQFLTPEEKARVVTSFLQRTIGTGVQGLYRNDPDRDMAEKSVAIDKLLKDLNVKPPANLNKMKQEYKKNYRMTPDTEELVEAAPSYKRKGVPHIYNPGSSVEMKDNEFIKMCQEIAKNNGTLDGVKINLKVDGSGIKFGKDESGKPFVMKKDGELIYKKDVSKFTKLGDPNRKEVLKMHEDSINLILDSDFIKSLPNNTIVSAEMLYTPMGKKSEQGLVFIRIPYDIKKLGKLMTLVVYDVQEYNTGKSLQNADKIINNLEKQSNNDIKIMSNRLSQQQINLTNIIKPVLALNSKELNTPQAKQVLSKARKKISDAIIDSPKLLGKDKLGSILEGIVINFPSGMTVKVTSDYMKNVMARQKSPAPKRTGPKKTAVVAIGSFVGHKGHEQLWNYTLQKAKELGGDPYLFIGSNVGEDDPILPNTKVATWHKLYPDYANNISTINVPGGTLIKKIKHELINPTPGQPPKYDNIIIMVGEDKKNLNFPETLMRSVHKFPGYEHVNVSLGVTPRGTGISFTQLRNILKDPKLSQQQKYKYWAERFDEKKLGKQWIKHLMKQALEGMNMKSKLKEFYQNIRPLLHSASIEQKQKLAKLLESAIKVEKKKAKNAKVKVAENTDYLPEK